LVVLPLCAVSYGKKKGENRMLQEYVSSVSDIKGILQVLYIDIVKVDLDIAHVVMATYVCFKCIFYVSSFQTYVANVLSGC
jgi:hypothetical protein